MNLPEVKIIPANSISRGLNFPFVGAWFGGCSWPFVQHFVDNILYYWIPSCVVHFFLVELLLVKDFYSVTHVSNLFIFRLDGKESDYYLYYEVHRSEWVGGWVAEQFNVIQGAVPELENPRTRWVFLLFIVSISFFYPSGESRLTDRPLFGWMIINMRATE